MAFCFLWLLRTSILLCLVIQLVEPYCIYNKTERRTINLSQKPFHTNAGYFSLFKSTNLPPGGSDCCPYTSSDCSALGTKDDAVMIEVSVFENIFYTVSLPAGGWVNVKETYGNSIVDFEVFYANGEPYQHTSMNEQTDQLFE